MLVFGPEAAAQAATCSATALKCWAETWEHVAVIAASVIGGLWALLRLYRERGFDSALTIDASAQVIPGAQPLVFVEITLTNVGKVDLQAKPSAPNEIAYPNDGVEELKYSGSLQVKKLTPLVSPDAQLDWFDDTKLEKTALDEINLLNAYADPADENRPDFWMEPGETYHLGLAVTLSSGFYLAKVTFIGARNNRGFWTSEFWRRTIRKFWTPGFWMRTNREIWAHKFWTRTNREFWTRIFLIQVDEPGAFTAPPPPHTSSASAPSPSPRPPHR